MCKAQSSSKWVQSSRASIRFRQKVTNPLNLLFLLPAIHALPTGGNVYNRRMIDALSRLENVQIEMHPFHVDSRTSEAIRNLDGVDAVIVDSLLLPFIHPDDTRQVPFMLLTHYVHICDPTASEADRRLSERSLLSRYDGFITTSHYTKNCLIKAGARSDQIRVAYPGLDTAYRIFEHPPAQSLDTCRMLTVASLLPGKGLSDHVQLLEHLDHLSWTWDIIGEGSLDSAYRDQLLDELMASPVGDRIQWAGPQEEKSMPDLYREYDLFVLPSRFETLGMVVRESMAAGLPVVAYDVGGVSESLAGGGGVLVHPYHHPQMIDELARLIEAPDERSELGDQGLQQSMYFPSWHQAAESFYEAMNELLVSIDR